MADRWGERSRVGGKKGLCDRCSAQGVQDSGGREVVVVERSSKAGGEECSEWAWCAVSDGQVGACLCARDREEEEVGVG